MGSAGPCQDLETDGTGTKRLGRTQDNHSAHADPAFLPLRRDLSSLSTQCPGFPVPPVSRLALLWSPSSKPPLLPHSFCISQKPQPPLLRSLPPASHWHLCASFRPPSRAGRIRPGLEPASMPAAALTPSWTPAPSRPLGRTQPGVPLLGTHPALSRPLSFQIPGPSGGLSWYEVAEAHPPGSRTSPSEGAQHPPAETCW